MNQENLHNMRGVLAPHAEPDDHVDAENAFDTVEVGQWYWVLSEDDQEDGKWLGCVMEVGSNYIRLRSPGQRSHYTTRVHFNNFWKSLRFEPNADAVIRGRIEQHQQEAGRFMDEVKSITARLGVSQQSALPSRPTADGNGGALVVMTEQPDIKSYEKALILARDKTLPELFKKIQQANEKMADWMTASTLPMEAMAKNMGGVIREINNRVFNVSLYAGLTEEIVKCCDGMPAAFHEKLHVFQRRLFMDEECLLNYRHGGMEFCQIEAFDDWMSLPENRDRILPFPRCLVTMRVRRLVKDRKWDGSLRNAMININLERADKLTFLYLRNGDQVWRLSSDLDFGELIFPDKTVFDPSEPMMAKMFGSSRVDKLLSRREYEEMEREYRESKVLRDQWDANNPNETWDEGTNGPRWMSNPHRNTRALDFRASEYQPFDPTSVYFDDMTAIVGDEIKQYNRIALIIQGLFDRSEVFHPHPPVKTWTQDGFNAAVDLVYDGTSALVNGETPYFEAYRDRCNASLNTDSVVIGQERFWLNKLAQKEDREDSRYLSKPYGNDGPGRLAKMAKWHPRSRKAVFAWYRERLRDEPGHYSVPVGKRYGDPIRATITVPASELFNVSAYRPGDYKQFFQDHRTRAQYLQWAPMLIAAEEYWAGNAKVQEPVCE